ncbi:MAG: sigma-70 family RNA polymerase sigma factor [Candidatus Melainabacteria bacterium]|nr:sigma-70 family RNA polymerase sigma factor [Candidatus Melainabacteria bacterium]
MVKSKENIQRTSEVNKDFLGLGKEKPPLSTKELFIGPETGNSDDILKRYLPIIEMVVKKEYKTIPSYLAEYSELINVGLLTVNKLLNEVISNKKTYNSSYIAQAVKWAIKDELRVKYNWYGVKQNQLKDKSSEAFEEEGEYPKELTGEDSYNNLSKEEANEKVFETILYLEDFPTETATKEQLTTDELARLELQELKEAVKRAVDKLPPKHKRVIELRFYEGKRGNDIASWLGVTPSRVSHMIQDAITKVRQTLSQEGFGE